MDKIDEYSENPNSAFEFRDCIVVTIYGILKFDIWNHLEHVLGEDYYLCEIVDTQRSPCGEILSYKLIRTYPQVDYLKRSV